MDKSERNSGDKNSENKQDYDLLQEELRRSEERYHKMIAEVQDYAILLLNKNGVIQNWNAGAEIIKGYKASEIIGKNFRQFYTPEDIKTNLPDRLLKAAEDTGRAASEGWRKRKDGSLFWASVVITALHDENGAIIGFSKVTRDLTERKKYEDRLLSSAIEMESKNQELEILNAELSSFAYVVSHDLKEPVRKIRIFADRQLEEGKTLEEIKKFTNKIISSAEHMQALMESVLLYSRISNESATRETVDLNEILQAVTMDLEIPIQENNAHIFAENLPVVTGINFQLYQLFLNLISNAIKFSKPGISPAISITTTLLTKESLPSELPLKNKTYYRISFADKGIGFEQDQAEKIFDVFKRLKIKKDPSGTGIGLSIVKKVTFNHHGYVMAESQPDQGAIFHIFLPVTD